MLKFSTTLIVLNFQFKKNGKKKFIFIISDPKAGTLTQSQFSFIDNSTQVKSEGCFFAYALFLQGNDSGLDFYPFSETVKDRPQFDNNKKHDRAFTQKKGVHYERNKTTKRKKC